MPPRHNKSEQALPDQTLIVDNGAYTIKAGFAKPSPELEDCHVVQNCVARDREKEVWVGSHLDNCQDFGSLAFRRPIEKGYVVNWEGEKAIWESIFFDKGARLKVDLSRQHLWETLTCASVRSTRDELSTYRRTKCSCHSANQL